MTAGGERWDTSCLAAVTAHHRITLSVRARTAHLVVSPELSCRLAWRAVELLDVLEPHVRLLRVDLRRVHVYEASALRFLVTAVHTWSLLRSARLDVAAPAPGAGEGGPPQPAGRHRAVTRSLQSRAGPETPSRQRSVIR